MHKKTRKLNEILSVSAGLGVRDDGYDSNAATNYELRINAMYEISDNWVVMGSVSRTIFSIARLLTQTIKTPLC
jgi:hypothetical protein